MADFELFPDLQNTISQMQTIEASIGNMVSSAEKLLEKFNSLPKSTVQTNVNPKLYTEAAAQAQALAKAYNDLIKVQATYTAQQEQTTQAQIAQTQATKEAISNKRLEIQANNEGVSAYQRMKAAVELEHRALLNLGATQGTTSKAFKDAQISLQNNAKALHDLEQATGGVTRGVGDAYGPMFSFTQILREMPNFAISARIGFMSLSNNIPMFVDEFKRFSQSINETTGKAVGAMGAFKQMGAALFGFNGIAVAATTILTLYGAQIGKFVEKCYEAIIGLKGLAVAQKEFSDNVQNDKGSFTTENEKMINLQAALVQTSNALKLGTKAFKDFSGESRSSIENAPKLLKAWQDVARVGQLMKTYMGAKMDKSQNDFLDSLNKISTVGGAKNAIVTLQNLYNYYQPLINASAAASDGVKKFSAAINDLVQDKEKLKDETFKKIFDTVTPTKEQLKRFNELENYYKKVMNEQKQLSDFVKKNGAPRSYTGEIENQYSKLLTTYTKDETAFSAIAGSKTSIYRKYYEDAKKIDKDILDNQTALNAAYAEILLDRNNTDKKAASARIRVLQDYNIQPEELNQLKGALEADKAYQKSILDDETQSLKKRLEAEQQYYFDSIALIKTETIKEEQQATDKFNKQEAQIDKIHRNNLLKISQNNAAIIDIQKKADADLSKLAQDYEKDKSSAKGTDDLTRLKNEYQEKANAINKYVQDSISNQGKLSKQTQNYNNAEYLNRKTLVDKLFYLTEKEISDSHKVAIARKEDLAKIYSDEVNYLIEKNQLDAKNAKNENEKNDLARQYNTLMEQRKNIGTAEALGGNAPQAKAEYQSLMETLNQYDLKQKQLSIDIDLANKNLAANKSTLADLSGLYTQVTFENAGTEAEKLTNDVNKLTDAYMKGDLTYAQYDEATKKIASTYNDSTQKQAKSATNLYSTIQQTQKNITKAVQDSDNATAALDKAVWDERIALAEKGNAMLSNLATDSKNSLISTWSSYNSYMDTLGTNQINQLSEDKDKKDEIYDAEVEKIQLKNEAGVLSDTEATEKENTLKAEKNSYDKAIEKEQNKIKKESFERDKRYKMAKIIMDTASAIATIEIKQQEYAAILAAEMGYAAAAAPAISAAIYVPLLVTTTIDGALQLASVAASQYSAYAQGTLGTKRDEMAWVGDGGKNELIVDPSGKMAVSPNKPTLTYLKRGTKVFPDISNLNDIETEVLLRNIGLAIPEEKGYDFTRLEDKLDCVVSAVGNNRTIINVTPSLFDKLDKRKSL